VVRYFRCSETGEAIFGINEWGGISHITGEAGEVLGRLTPGWYDGTVLVLSPGTVQLLGSILAGVAA
jgi:hypothetical protein